MAEIHDIAPLPPPPVIRPARPRDRVGEGKREPRPRDKRPQADEDVHEGDPGHVDEYA